MKDTDQKENLTDEIVDIISMAPWWICFILAALSYIITDHFSSEVAHPARTGSFRLSTMILMREIVSYGKFILPAIFSAAGVISLMQKFKRR